MSLDPKPLFRQRHSSATSASQRVKAVALVVVLAALSLMEIHQLAIQKSEEIADGLVQRVLPAMLVNDTHQVNALLERTQQIESIQSIHLVSADGSTLVSLTRHEDRMMAQNSESFELASVQEDEFALRRMETPLIFDGHLIGSLSMSINLWPIYMQYITTMGGVLLMVTCLWLFGRGLALKIRFENESQSIQATDTDYFHNILRLQLKKAGIELVYQPIVRMSDLGVFGVEVMVSWSHPSGQTFVLSPAEFIQMSERQGLILPVAEWIYRVAAQSASHWQKEFGPLIVSMNITSAQLRNEQFSQKIKQVFSSVGYPFQLLELELAESELMSWSPTALSQRLTDLQSQHLSVTADGFGLLADSVKHMGFVQKICLDFKLVKTMLTDDSVLDLVQCLLQNAHSQDIQVRAQGVDTPQQLEKLKQLGVLFAQGQAISAPLNESQVHAYLAQRHSLAATLTSPSLELA